MENPDPVEDRMNLELVIESLGGMCPVQGEGRINDKPFPFRARYAAWRATRAAWDAARDRALRWC